MDLIDKMKYPSFLGFYLRRGLFYPYLERPFGIIFFTLIFAPIIFAILQDTKSDYEEFHLLVNLFPFVSLFLIELWCSYTIYFSTFEISGTKIVVFRGGKEVESYKIPNHLLSIGKYDEKGEFLFFEFHKSLLKKNYPFENPQCIEVLEEFLENNNVRVVTDNS